MDVDVLTNVFDNERVTPDNVILYDQILDIYQDEFLKGFNLPDSLSFDEWALLKREQYARMMDTIFERISDYYEKLGDYESAVPFAWRHVELEPWQERARRQLMRLLCYTGRRDEALQQFHDLENALDSELKINPGTKSRRLYIDILGGMKTVTSQRLSVSTGDLPPFPNFLEPKKASEVDISETFVGRLNELNRLHTLLEGITEGRGSFVMVAGEAGSGKTMLVREFIRQAQSNYPNLVSAIGYCSAFTEAGDPYLPLREILYQLSGDIESYWKAGSCSYQNAVNLWNLVPVTCQSLLTYSPDLIDTFIPGQILLEFTASQSITKTDWFTALDEHLRNKHQHQVTPFSRLT